MVATQSAAQKPGLNQQTLSHVFERAAGNDTPGDNPFTTPTTQEQLLDIRAQAGQALDKTDGDIAMVSNAGVAGQMRSHLVEAEKKARAKETSNFINQIEAQRLLLNRLDDYIKDIDNEREKVMNDIDSYQQAFDLIDEDPDGFFEDLHDMFHAELAEKYRLEPGEIEHLQEKFDDAEMAALQAKGLIQEKLDDRFDRLEILDQAEKKAKELYERVETMPEEDLKTDILKDYQLFTAPENEGDASVNADLALFEELGLPSLSPNDSLPASGKPGEDNPLPEDAPMAQPGLQPNPY